MAFIGKSIPNLINGVSQQPTEVRLPSQCEEQVNMLSSVVDGLKRRPGTRHIANLIETNAAGAFVHVYNRDRFEKYIVVVINGNIRVFDFEGAERTVNKPHGLTYLATQTASESIKAVTVADYTFILNKDVVARAYDPNAGFVANPVNQNFQILSIHTELSIKPVTDGLTRVGAVPSTWSSWERTYDEYNVVVNGKQYKRSTENTTRSTYVAWLASQLSTDLNRAVTVYGNTVVIPLRNGQAAYAVSDLSIDRKITLTTTSETVEGAGFYTTSVQTLESPLVSVMSSSVENRVTGYVSASGAVVPDAEVQLKEGLVFVRLGDYGTTYKIRIDDIVVASHTTPTSDRPSIGTGTIAQVLFDQMTASTVGWELSYALKGNVIRVRATTQARDFTLTVEDSSGDKAMTACKGRVQTFAVLPAVAFDGFTIKVSGQNGVEADDYYVRYTETGTGLNEKTSGSWIEVAKKGLRTRPAPQTMPHRLISNADGTFTFERVDWSARTAGDEDSAPEPSFINNKINDIFFYKNRLGLLSEENVILSEDGSYYMFYPSTVIQYLDSHPIDISVTNDSISVLKHAVPFNEALLLFSDRTQFIIAPEERLTSETISVDVTTRFETPLTAKPVGAGKNVFFSTKSGPYASLREYFVDPESNVNDASDIASHCPRYIQGDIRLLAASPNEDLVVCVTDAAPTSMYVYKYYWQGNEKVQSSWSRWEFKAPILGMSFVDSVLTLVLARGGKTVMETMRLSGETFDTGRGFPNELCLDRRQYVAAGSAPAWTDPLAVAVDRTGRSYSGDTLTALKDAQGRFTKDVIVGVPYRSYYEFSKLVLMEGDSRVAPLVGRLQLRTMTVKYVESGYFEAGYSSGSGEPNVVVFNGRRIGASTNILGKTPIDSGRFKFPTFGHAPDTTIWLESSSHLPAAFLSAEWEALFHRFSRRI